MEVNSNEDSGPDCTSGDEAIEENMQDDAYKTFEDTEMVNTATTSGVKRTSDGEVEGHSKLPKKSDNCDNYEDGDEGRYSENVDRNEEDNVEDNAEDNIESNAEYNEQNEDGGSDNSNETPSVKVESKSAFDGHTTTHRIYIESFEDDEDDAQIFFRNVHRKLQRILGEALLTQRKFKAVFNLHGHRIDNTYEYFDITDTIVVREGNRYARLQSACNTIVHKFNKQNQFGKHISYLDLHIHRYVSETSSFLEFVNYQHVVNVDSGDHASFKWAVLAAWLHPEVNHPDVNSLEKYSEKLKIDEIEHPVKLQAIPRIEELNNMSFNVYVVKNKEIEGPVYYSKCRREIHHNLLLLHKESRSHYCLIKDLGRLVDESKTAHICDGCLCFFEEEDTLQRHQKLYCLQVKTIAVAGENNILKYLIPKNGYNCHYMPIVVYAKFKAFAFLEPPANKDNVQEYLKSINKLEPYCFAYYIKCSFIDEDQVFKPRKYSGPDCVRYFIKKIKSDLNKLINSTRKIELKHISEIPVIFHNFKNYDGHFVIKGIPSMPRTRPRRVIGSTESFEAIHEAIQIQNKEIELKFLDSTNFLSGSLTNLAEKLNEEEFHELRNCFANDTSFRLLSQGIAFPTESITSHEDFNQTILPEITADFTAEEYERAQEVWHHFGCKDIQEYLNLHMKTSVFLLADVFERFRSFCKTKYQTDPAKFHSISETSWVAMLKFNNVELELPTNVNMSIFLKNAVANNICFHKDKTKSYLTYYTENNLQDWAMAQPLPYGHFEWAEVDVDFHVPVDSDVGYFLEVDLMEPDEMKIKDWVVDLPFWPAKPAASASHGNTHLLERSYHVLHHSYLIQCEEHGFKFKVNRVLKFKQKPWLASYVRANKERMTTATSDLEKDYYKQLNKSIFAKIIQDLEENDKLETCVNWFQKLHNRGGYDMVGSPEYHSHSIASDKMIVVKLNKTKVSCNKPIYVGASILDLSKGHILKILLDENS